MQMFPDKYIVLTGGAGLIGSGVLRVLNDQGIKNVVIVEDIGTNEHWKNLVGKQFWEIIHKDELFSWLKGKEREIEAFIHLGACSSTVEKDANYLLSNNYRYSIRLAEYALENEHRFIYASSAATYGNGEKGFSDAHEALHSFEPLNMYGYSKHLFDLWLYEQNLLDKVVGLKYFNVFGPNEFHKGRMSSAVLKMVPEALETGKISLFKSSEPEKFADGEQVRDFLYVKDAARMTVQFLQNEEGGIFNVGAGRPETWNDLAKGVIKALDRPIAITYHDMPEDLLGKYQNYTCADMSKSEAKGLLKTAYSLEDAVVEYVRSYLLTGRHW
ncbi:MAG: ADP-L-glycero-D-manno-heptose-6-epimerase [Chlamydiae bacterium]|nr:ADP-L-glycero-D-manno-heptose-6-epimerase [Chlamydiota bacterium]